MSVAGSVQISLVAAVGRRGELGREGRLLFRLRSDLAHFKKLTLGKPVVMGRRTWESLPKRPLPSRPNLVVSRNEEFFAPGAHIHSSIEGALAAARAMAVGSGGGEVFVIGGADVYAAALDHADRLWLTEVEAEADADVFFPKFDRGEWIELSRDQFDEGPGDEHAFVIRELGRRRPSSESD